VPAVVVLALAALLVLPDGSAVARAAGEPAEPPAPFKGIGEDDVLWDRTLLPGAVESVQRLRGDFLKATLHWSRVAPSRPSQPRQDLDLAYDWSAFDRIVDAARAARLPMLVTLWSTPEWATGGWPTYYLPDPGHVGDFANFVHAAVTRYARRAPGLIKWWEVWNEPNVSFFAGPQLGAPAAPRRYAQLVDATYPVIKDADPDAQVLAGAVAPKGANNDFSTRPIDFLREMTLEGGARPRFDQLSLHPYPLYLGTNFRPAPIERQGVETVRVPVTRPVRRCVRRAGRRRCTVVRVPVKVCTTVGRGRAARRVCRIKTRAERRPKTVVFQSPLPPGALDLASLPGARDALRSFFGAKPVFVSEVGVLTRPNRYYETTVPEAAQGETLTRIWGALRRLGIDHVVHYPLRDSPSRSDEEGRETAWSGGVQNEDGSEKPAFRDLARLGRNGGEPLPPGGGGLVPPPPALPAPR
jgi:hypothetical protein